MFKNSKKMRANKFILIIRKLFPNIKSIKFSLARLVAGQCYQINNVLFSLFGRPVCLTSNLNFHDVSTDENLNVEKLIQRSVPRFSGRSE